MYFYRVTSICVNVHILLIIKTDTSLLLKTMFTLSESENENSRATVIVFV